MEDAKKATEEMFFKKWVKSEKTEDGWVFSWESPKLDSEMNEAGVQYSFDVRRKIGDKVYTCNGAIAKAEGLDAVVEACNSIKPL